MAISIKNILTQTIPILAQSGSDTPRLDTEVLLAHLLQKDRSWLYAHNDFLLPAETEEEYAQLIQRRTQQEPVAYIIGEQEFYGLPFYVTPQVLIPRPETELLVETALELIQPNNVVIDVGSGSGCIAVALARYAPGATIIAADISSGALDVARQNARRHKVSHRLAFLQADLLTGLHGPFDALLSNPPYVSSEEMKKLAPGVRNYEPALALSDGSSGLTIIETLLQDASSKIRSGGALLIELGAGQGAPALALAQKYCPQAKFRIKQDLAHRDRLLLGRF